MKKEEMYVLDEEDEKVVQLFVELGIPKNVAKTLLYISNVDECHSAEIEQGARLRQPEVSIAIKHMAERGWIEERHVKRNKGKGRPVHVYKLNKPLSSVLDELKEDKSREIESVEKNLQELERLLNENKS
ncbi:MAG TPA: ArsR family transcriptional regulator [Thermoplasmatales archaeon]|nr:ArsR family transcriptional regulator [Thermoplasmatales archaeon]